MKRLAVYIPLLVFVLLFTGADVFGFGGCEEDCMKCHTIQTSEVQQILAKLRAPDAKVLDLRMSPVKGLWEAVIEDKGTRAVLYIGFSKKYIMGGPVVEVETAENKTGESLSKIDQANPRKVDVSKIPVTHALLMGSEKATYKAFVFTDPDCPFCGRLHAELKKAVEERSDIAFYLKLLPLPMHPDAHWKAESILCKGSLSLLEDNYAKKEIPKPDCKTSEPDENIKLAGDLGITGTPTIVTPSGAVVVGARDAKTLIDLITKTPEKKQDK
ncbi:MAG: DsbC family protein [Thermodesulfovibrionales bacterium]